MTGNQLHKELVKLHHMIDQLYDCFNPTKASSNIYLIIDEQYSKIMRELIAKGVFADGRDSDNDD